MELLAQISDAELRRQSSGHSAAQTAASIVMALAAVFAVIMQSKGDPKFAWGLFALILLALIWMYGNRALATFRLRTALAARDRAARAHHTELLRLARRFAQFASTGDWSNLRYVILSAYGNDPDKCAEICPPDYMRELCPFFLQHLETRPPQNERQFLLAIQELYGVIASYNSHYVLEPFRKMRMRRWRPASTPGAAQEAIVTWIESLPENNQENAERQIEDFRERWVSFLDDAKQWFEKTGELFTSTLPSYFERPQKL